MTLFLSLIIVALVLIIVFIVLRLHRFSFIKNIHNKWLSWLISFLPIIIILLLFNYVNALIIFVHLALFYLLFELIFYLIGKKTNYNIIGLMAIITTIIYLGIGAYVNYHVFETHYDIVTDKELGQDDFRILQISDAHIGSTFNGEGFYNHMKNLRNIDVDLLVITGDLVDDDTKYADLIRACEGLKLLNPKYGKYFIYGNHDKGYYHYRDFGDKELREELTKNGVIVLEDEIIKINDNIYLIGRLDKSNKHRKAINTLVKNLDKSKYIIDLNHQPNDYKNETNQVDLVLSGHTHGGQLFPLGYIGLITGSNDAFYGLEKRGNTNFIVSSGISDWKASFKTGTTSEYVIVNIKKEK